MRERINTTFRALRSRNFRLFFFGQGISLIGTWMQRIAMSWLIYRLTGSAFLLGVAGFSSHIPIFLISPFAGVLIDRFSRRRILFLSQTLAMLQAFVLAFLVLSGSVQVWHVIALGIVLGISSAFDIPGRQSFYSQLVSKKEDIQNAIALNSTLFHLARFIGPTLAGFVIAFFGEGICFLLNGVSFVAMLVALIMMKIEKINNSISGKKISEEFKEGFSYVFKSAPIKKILLIVALVSLFGAPYVVLLPIFAKDILGGGPVTLGLLTSFASIGALFSAFYIASIKTNEGTDKRLVIFGLIFSFSLIAFAFSKILGLSLFLISFVGAGMMANNVSANSLIQNLISEDKRGRVMSLYTFSHQGVMPFGELLFGILAGGIGAGPALAMGGVLSALSVFIFGRKISSN
ncbi:MFS transporter [Candidatus Giovannonibacteria bacterium]|nr:MFS transporter [Candidatus Giovannonibacteria bacterium]